MVGVWSTHAEIDFVSSLAFKGFGQKMLRYILCPRRYIIGLVYTCEVAFCVVAGMVRVWSSHVEIHFLSSMAF